VCKRIRALKATQKDIAARLGITQPQVSELKHGKFKRFSSDRLIALLGLLGCGKCASRWRRVSVRGDSR
jgi:predicted XRE-type DNA-binding protein